MHHYKYLGSSVEETAGMATEITQSECSMEKLEEIGPQWSVVWMPVKLRGNVYKTVVRPALFYGTETEQQREDNNTHD